MLSQRLKREPAPAGPGCEPGRRASLPRPVVHVRPAITDGLSSLTPGPPPSQTVEDRAPQGERRKRPKGKDAEGQKFIVTPKGESVRGPQGKAVVPAALQRSATPQRSGTVRIGQKVVHGESHLDGCGTPRGKCAARRDVPAGRLLANGTIEDSPRLSSRRGDERNLQGESPRPRRGTDAR